MSNFVLNVYEFLFIYLSCITHKKKKKLKIQIDYE